MDIVTDQTVRVRGRSGQAALDLRGFDTFRQGREGLRRGVPRLHFQSGPIDRSTVEARRRAGLEPPKRKA